MGKITNSQQSVNIFQQTTMYFCVILLLSCAVALGTADRDPKCRDLMHKVHKCCNSEGLKRPEPDKLKECHQIAKPNTCDEEICKAKNINALSDDGTIDKNVIMAEMNQHSGFEPPILDAISTNCIKGDVTKYGPDDVCELLKIRMCITDQIAKNCPGWSNEGECAGAQDDINECLQKFQ